MPQADLLVQLVQLGGLGVLALFIICLTVLIPKLIGAWERHSKNMEAHTAALTRLSERVEENCRESKRGHRNIANILENLANRTK